MPEDTDELAERTTGYMSDVFTESTMFGHLPIAFDDRVLRPRRWTVAQSRWAAELLRTAPTTSRILELCAGAGQIGLLALALGTSSRHRLVAVDVNPVACEFARRNAVSAGLDDQVEIRRGLIDAILDPDERFDLVIADPPWVARAHTTQFPDDPVLAIDGGADGLDVAFSCLRVAEAHLVDGGSLLLQLGTLRQADRVDGHLREDGSVLSVIEARPIEDRGVLVHLTRQIRQTPDNGGPNRQPHRGR